MDPGPTKAVRGWHGRDWTFNRAFVDAHAETQRVIIEGTADEHGYLEHFRHEWTPRAPRLAGFYRGIRGDGWQKDTWPVFGEPLDLPLFESMDRHPYFEGCVTACGSEGPTPLPPPTRTD